MVDLTQVCDEFDPLTLVYKFYHKLAGLGLMAKYKRFQKQLLKLLQAQKLLQRCALKYISA